MGADTKIAWCHHTHNPWIGCTEVSPGCAHCYARDNYGVRFGIQWGDKGTRRRKAESGLREPMVWNRAAMKVGERRRVFCGSLCDVMEERPELGPWRDQLWQTILFTPWLDWLLLTKRPQNFSRFLPKGWLDKPLPNVWLGTTVEDQKRADERIPHLLDVPAAVRFLSCEPLLEALDLTPWLVEPGWWCPNCQRTKSPVQVTYEERCTTCGTGVDWRECPDWIIVGGESGKDARPFNVEWARSIRDQCKAAGVACFVKQLGARPYDPDWHGDGTPEGSKMLLDHPKGGDPAEWPADLRVREMPALDVAWATVR